MCVVQEGCSTEYCSVRWVPRLCPQALHKYTFSLDVMRNGIGNVFSSMLFDVLGKHLFGCAQVTQKLDIMP